MTPRLGQLLVEAGLLTPDEVRTVLAHQQKTGEPFGLLCERLHGVEPDAIEDIWAEQYAQITRRIDPAKEAYEERALELVTRRQAWQFCLMPIRFDGEELMIATTRQGLRRALRFATNVIGLPVFFVLASPQALGEALCKRYPLPGLTPRAILDGRITRFLASRGAPRSAAHERHVLPPAG